MGMGLVLSDTRRRAVNGKAADKRSHTRYSLSTPLRYRLLGLPGSQPWRDGRSLNISAGGILMEIPEEAPRGSILEVTVDWPGVYHNRPMVRLSLVGSAVRVDSRGTAVRLLSRRFLYDLAMLPKQNAPGETEPPRQRVSLAG